MRTIFATLFAVALLFGCASTPNKIVATPAAGSAPIPIAADLFIGKDLLSSQWNLQQAAAIGAIPANDPALVCVTDVVHKTGLDGSAPPASFVPKNDGLISAGVIAYIIAQQAQALKGGIAVSPACLQLIGKNVVDGAAVVNRALPISIPGLLK